MANRYNDPEPEDVKLKMLIYGKPGAGKTTLAASACYDPRMGRVLMLESFGNPIALRHQEKKPDIITIEDIKDFNEPYKWLSDGQDPNDSYARKHGLQPPYDTLIIDGLTEVQRFVIRKVIGTSYGGPGDMVGKLQRQGFGQILATMLNWAVHFVQLDMHVLLTTLEATRIVQNEPTFAHPLLWGQLESEISGYFYAVTRVVQRLAAPKILMKADVDPMTKTTFNMALFKETLGYYAKEQYGFVAPHVTDPTILKIMDLVERS